MIPTIGLMVGGYILLRCIQIADEGRHWITRIIAALAFIFTIICMIGLLDIGTETASNMQKFNNLLNN